MPLYEYQCEKCGHRFEKIESFSASTTKKCPKCGAKAERMLAAPAIQFKGSGWYVTDYAGKSGSGTKSDGSESKAASDKSEKSEKPEKSSDASSTKKTPAKEKTSSKDTK